MITDISTMIESCLMWLGNNILAIISLIVAIIALAKTSHAEKHEAKLIYQQAKLSWIQHVSDNHRSEDWTDVSALRLFDESQISSYIHASRVLFLSRNKNDRRHAVFLERYADYITNHLTTHNNRRSDKLDELREELYTLSNE